MKITAIALNTFREAVRDRILYSILAFALLLIGASAILASLSIGQEGRIVKDLGLASTSLFGTLIAIFLGIGLVFKEIERRSIFVIISKPIHRFQFLLGKYIGLVLTLLSTVGVMALLVTALAWVMDGYWSAGLLGAAALDFLALMIVTAVALLFSTFSTPTLSAIFTLAVFVIGRLSGDLKLFADQFAGPGLRLLMEGLYMALPDLSRFQIGAQIVNALPLAPREIFWTVTYGLAYILMLLLVAVGIFQCRDFK
ncbi:MAG TPA: ABC transporter permease subunit [Candidatus Methylomirabilis sp.]|nr:ABC transporter permease subunit [Candidatus Methylomirabilis sp.]